MKDPNIDISLPSFEWEHVVIMIMAVMIMRVMRMMILSHSLSCLPWLLLSCDE